MEPLNLPTVSGEKYANTTVELDNRRFENCEFRNCELIYSGGPVQTSSCYFENTRWSLQGSAALVVATMRAFGWGIETPNLRHRTSHEPA